MISLVCSTSTAICRLAAGSSFIDLTPRNQFPPSLKTSKPGVRFTYNCSIIAQIKVLHTFLDVRIQKPLVAVLRQPIDAAAFLMPLVRQLSCPLRYQQNFLLRNRGEKGARRHCYRRVLPVTRIRNWDSILEQTFAIRSFFCWFFKQEYTLDG